MFEKAIFHIYIAKRQQTPEVSIHGALIYPCLNSCGDLSCGSTASITEGQTSAES